ncbi:VanZ family protein [Glutamicibacter sp. NPDC087344]|uniref:VanZ family protein n=1 Tax=Glutamicibacter sp. NPDC087344 TaxID=3363994 RepID=UPI00382073B9
MNSMIWPGAIAVLGSLLFLGAAGVFLLAVQYRRHGRLSWRRTITTAAASLYGFALFSYTMLPLPATRDAYCRPSVAVPQLQAGHFIQDFAAASQLGLRSFSTSFTLWQVLFNIILFMPLGILAVRWLRGNVLTAVVLGLVASLAIELTQYTGIWGLYTCAYRVADVDDLIMNTFGALLGGAVAYLPVFAFLAPPREPRAAKAPPRPVTRPRRALANVFDAAFATAGVLLCSAGANLAQRLGGPSVDTKLVDLWVPTVVAALVFALPVLAPGRATLGQRCAWIRISGARGRPAPAWQAVLRTLLGFGGITWWVHVSTGIGENPQVPGLNTAVLVYAAISAVCFVLVPGTRALAGVLTGTGFADRRAAEAETV